MKKWINKQTIVSFILGAILFSGVGVGAASYYQFSLSQYSLYVDGTKVDNHLYMYQEANYLPLRAVAEALDLNTSVSGKRIDLTSKPTDIEEVAKNAESCVLIRVYSTTDPVTAKLVGTASGVVISDSVIATNKHVLDAGKMYGIQYDDTPAELDYKTTETYKIDTNLDIGFIKSPTAVKAVTVGDSSNLKIGQKVITISSPAGLKNQVSEGTISGLSDDADGQTVQVKANLDKGSSGSGIFNIYGELIGIAAAMPEGNNNYHYVIPINDIKPLLLSVR